MTVDSANADQISFIINLMHGYNNWDFDKKKTQMDLNKGRTHSIVLSRTNYIFLDTKKNLKKEIKSLLPNTYISKNTFQTNKKVLY